MSNPSAFHQLAIEVSRCFCGFGRTSVNRGGRRMKIGTLSGAYEFVVTPQVGRSWRFSAELAVHSPSKRLTEGQRDI